MLVGNSTSKEDRVEKKKIDYAIFLNHRSNDQTVIKLYAALKDKIAEPDWGLFTNVFTRTLTSLDLVEVKPAGDLIDAEVQLMTAASAQSTYLKRLLDSMASKSEAINFKRDALLARLPPVMSWMVRPHEWKLYVCHRIAPDKDGKCMVCSSTWAIICSENELTLLTGMGCIPLWQWNTASPKAIVELHRTVETHRAHHGKLYMAWLQEVFGLCV